MAQATCRSDLDVTHPELIGECLALYSFYSQPQAVQAPRLVACVQLTQKRRNTALSCCDGWIQAN